VNIVDPHLMQKLDTLAGNVSVCLLWLQSHSLLLSLLAGLTLPFIVQRSRENRHPPPFWRKFITSLAVFFFIAGTLAPLSFQALRYFFRLPDNHTLTNIPLWILTTMFTTAGAGCHITARRMLAGEIDAIRHRFIKRSRLERHTRTDIREVKAMLPASVEYDPLEYIDPAQGVFIGLDTDDQPQYISVNEFQSQHADIIGTTGSGKGISATVLLYQAILLEEAVFVEDPKNDEWAPHVLKKACEQAGKSFYLIDLNQLNYQLDLLAGISHEQLEELFNAGFSLSKKGEGADFYRIADRRAARHAAATYEPGMTLRDLFDGDVVTALRDTAPAFYGELEEIALVSAINARGGLSLQHLFDEGGCCYIIGSMRNQKIISAQRMILIRLIQIAETRDRIGGRPRPVAILLDELKYHLSRPALEGLGAARDKQVHIIMAHQSIKDLYDCPADLDGDAVAGSVIENCKFMLVYRLRDPDTADWVARMTGSILVDDEMRKISTDMSLTETVETERTIRQAERYYIDSNMLLSLPPFVGFVFTHNQLARATRLAHIRVQKQYIRPVAFTAPPPATPPSRPSVNV
jgi:hypothetical protein